MPRFIRGGRGLWRKCQSSNGLTPNNPSGKCNTKKDEPLPSPVLDKVFKWITMIIIFVGFVSFCVSCNDSQNTSGIAVCVTCIIILVLEIPTYMICYAIYSGIHDKKCKSNDEMIETAYVKIKCTMEDNKEKISNLVDKYQSAIDKYVNGRYKDSWNFFGEGFFSDTDFYLLYRYGDEDILKRFFLADGFDGLQPKYYAAKEATARPLMDGLYDNIKSNNEWSDANTVAVCMYYVIRNGIIKHYYYKYVNLYKNKTASDVCLEKATTDKNFYMRGYAEFVALYTFYSLYTEYINVHINMPWCLTTYYNSTKKIVYNIWHNAEQTVNSNQFFSELNTTEEFLPQQFLKTNIEKIQTLSDKYYSYTCNFFKNFGEENFSLFDTWYWPFKIPFYILTSDSRAEACIKYDGFETDKPSKEDHHIEKVTQTYIDILTNKLQESSEWAVNKTLLCVIYFIIRNGLVRFCHDKYKAEIGYETIEDMCENMPYESSHSSLFTYFYIYENDISLPLHDEAVKQDNRIKEIYERAEREKIEADIISCNKDDVVQLGIDTAEQITIDEINISPIQKVDMMTGGEFERFLADFFSKRGYKTTLTPLSGDYGIDLIIENDFIKIGIQAKCYSEKVSSSAVQEAVTAIRHYNLDKVMVVTNNYFQPSAIQLAKDNNVILWNRDKLIEELSK